MEKITRDGRRSRTMKEVVECVQSVVRMKIFVFQFRYGRKKNMSFSLLLFLSSKEEVEMDEPLSNSPKK